jgi:hypothetical protein
MEQVVVGFTDREDGTVPVWDCATGTVLATFSAAPVMPRGEPPSLPKIRDQIQSKHSTRGSIM